MRRAAGMRAGRGSAGFAPVLGYAVAVTEIAARRLAAQHLTGVPLASPVEAVGLLGAVQSQDYAGAKWALALRADGVRDADLDRMFDDGAILRTHVMRPTWHFVLPGDIRWLLELTAPRVKARMLPYQRQLEVDTRLIRRSEDALAAALSGGPALTRPEVGAVLERAGLAADGQRLGHVLMNAELDAVVTSGPRRGKQHTYALVADRAPMARTLDRDEALGELARRYFGGHGPAQAVDFAWWSGLTIADARRGAEVAGPELVQESIDGKVYWSGSTAPVPGDGGPSAHLLPNYDEFIVAFRDRGASLDPSRDLDTTPFPYGSILSHVVVVDGQVRGGWRRQLTARAAVVELLHRGELEDGELEAIQAEVERYGRFLGIPASLVA